MVEVHAKDVLVIGQGGREHALCWKLSQSPDVNHVYCAPGNGGTEKGSGISNVAIAVDDFDALIAFVKEKNIGLTVVGPDNPLADGIVDAFEAQDCRVFGPNQAAAQLESSKVFAKHFMQTHGLPTATFQVVDNKDDAWAFCQANDWARVIKVDGLALGKGVFVCDTLADCERALQTIFDNGRFGEASAQIVLEERLVGPEVSLMVLSDGHTLVPMASSQDFKRRFEEDKGPNTGGMGAYSPVPLSSHLQTCIQEQVLQPLETALRHEATLTFKGLLYVGLLIVGDTPYVLEFNARFGDPETQCLLPRLTSDLMPLFEACVDGTLHEQTLVWAEKAATCVVLSGASYPESSSKGTPIHITPLPEDTLVFHAGTRYDATQGLVTNGGRVLNVVGLGDTLAEATQKAYQAVMSVQFDDMAYRGDIASHVSQEANVCLST